MTALDVLYSTAIIFGVPVGVVGVIVLIKYVLKG